MKITIDWKEKELKIATVYTRAIDRGFNDIILKDSTTWVNEKNETKITLSPIQISRANDFLLVAMAWLTTNEVDSLDMNTYNEVLEAVQKVKTPWK